MKKSALPARPKLPPLPKFDVKEFSDQFRNLDPKDIGNWPTAPKIVSLIVLFLLVLAAGWWFDWSQQTEKLNKITKQEATYKEEFLQKKKQSVNLDEYRKQLTEIDRSFGIVLKQLPNKAEMEALLIDINQAGLGRGLQFELFKPGAETVKEFYAELPIQLRLTGSYHDLGAFAGDIAKLPRIVALSELVMEGTPNGGIKFEALATTYRYLDLDELEKIKKAKDEKAGKGKGAAK